MFKFNNKDNHADTESSTLEKLREGNNLPMRLDIMDYLNKAETQKVQPEHPSQPTPVPTVQPALVAAPAVQPATELDAVYKSKYLKYKGKYLSLMRKSNMKGGSSKVTPILTLKLYKSDRCGFCTSFMPAWKEAQTTYKKDSEIEFITLDADNDRELINNANIQGFPTVHILSHKGDLEEYNGDRTHKGLVTRIEELLKSYKI